MPEHTVANLPLKVCTVGYVTIHPGINNHNDVTLLFITLQSVCHNWETDIIWHNNYDM